MGSDVDVVEDGVQAPAVTAGQPLRPRLLASLPERSGGCPHGQGSARPTLVCVQRSPSRSSPPVKEST